MKKSVNIILIVILACLVGALGFFGFKLITSGDKVLVPDFSNKTVNDVNTWCGSLENVACSITYDYSDSIDKDYVVYQSISPNEEIYDSISFIISAGKKVLINLPTIDKNTTKETIEAWAKENGITNINFVEEANDTVDKGGIIKIEPSEIYATDTPINVFISTGKKEDVSNAIEIESEKYINLTVTEFETKVKALGLKPTHATEKDDTSSSVTKGNIVWHGSGTYEKDETIRYGVCKGVNVIEVTKGSMVGLTVEEFKTAVTKLGTKGLKPTHKDDYDSYSSTVAKDLIVFHGSGDYDEEEEIGYGISKGVDEDKIIISYGSYLGKSVDDLTTAVKSLGSKGLPVNHKSDKDEYSSTIEKGKIVWHGAGEYEDGETVNYGLSLGKDSSKETTDDKEIVVKQGDYVGKTLSEFEKAVKDLGLVPFHRSEWDVKDTTKTSNTIARNGYGTYVKDEKISYGLYIGNESGDIVITRGQYVGKTLDEFKKICSDLGIVPEHSEVYTDDYSDTIAKGSLDYHGSGTYTKGEVIHYTLSLGKKADAPKINVENYAGKTETEFKTYLTSKNLKAGTRTTEYSDNVAAGIIISNDTGSIAEGSSINYKVSLGKDTRVNVGNYAGKDETELTTFLTNNGLKGSKSEEHSSSVAAGKIISNTTGLFDKDGTVSYKVSLGKAQFNIMSADSYNSLYSKISRYDDMVNQLKTGPFANFTNVTYQKGNDYELTSGMIISIKVGNTTSYSPGDYDSDIAIVVTIQE